MANGGWYGTQDEWDRFEAPLMLLDDAFNDFAERHKLEVRRNHKDWPARSVSWGNGAECLIQLYVAHMNAPEVILWICASVDRGHERYWRHERLIDSLRADHIVEELPEQLDLGFKRLHEWCMHTESFEFATALSM